MAGRKRTVVILIALVLAVLTYFLMPAQIGSGEDAIVIPELARRTCAIFMVAAVFWATEVIPLFATSLCVIGMQIIFLSGKGGLAELFPALHAPLPEKLPGSQSFLDPFASGVIMLFLGGFLLAEAVSKHGLDKAIASRLLRPFSRSPMTLLFGVLCVTAFFSMWMSNTATTVMMIAIIAPLLKELPETDKFHRAIILAVPFGANIGGIGTPIGTPPNAVALAALRQQFPDLTITFLDWMMMAVPLVVILTIATGLLLYLFFPPLKGIPLPRLERPTEKISTQGRATMVILATAIVLWVFGDRFGLSEAAVALLAAAALTALGVLTRKDVDSIDWNVLILMWGGLSLGAAMQSSGMVNVIASLPFDQVSGFMLATVITLVAVGIASFMSHTAATNVIVPVVIAVGLSNVDPSQGVADAIYLTLLASIATSFAMALPVSTPPNAIAFATGKIPATDMLRSGGLIGIICVIVLLMGHQIVLPRLIDIQSVILGL